MKSKSFPLFAVSRSAKLAAVVLSMVGSSLWAGSLTWDGSNTGNAAADGGAGTWDPNTTANWWNGSTDVVWPASGGTDDDAVFANTAGTVTIAAGGVTANDLTFSTAGYLLSSGTLTLNGGTTPIITANASASISSVIAGTNGLTKAGAGTLLLSGQNTYTGLTTITGGELQLASTTGSAVNGDITFNSTSIRQILSATQNNQFATTSVLRWTGSSGGDGRFELKGTSQTLGGIDTTGYAGAAWIQHSEFGSGAPVSANDTLTLSVASGASYNFNTSLGGGLRDHSGGKMSVVKTGSGTQTLAGGGISYTGTTTVSAGTLVLNSATFVSATTVNSGATLTASNFATQGINAPILLNNGATLTHNGLTNNADFWTNSQAVTVAAGAAVTLNETSVTNTTGANKGTFFDAGLKGGGGSVVTINATNAGNAFVLRNTGTSNYAGTIIVNGIANGTANLGSGLSVAGETNGLQNTAIQVNGTLEVGNTGLGWGGTDTATAFTMSALSGTGVVTNNNTTSARTLIVGNTNASGTYSGILQNGSKILSFTKIGSGTQTLSGANTFTGVTTVTGGTLEIGTSGSINNSAVTAQSTATLQTDAIGKTLAGLTLQGGSTLAVAAANGSTSITAPLTLSAIPDFAVRPIFSALPTVGTITLVGSTIAPGAAGTITTDFGTFGASRVTGSTSVNGNDLMLTVTNGAASLVWNNAAANSTWDVNTSANFNNGGNDVFKSYDGVTFDDTATAGPITLSGTLAASAVTVNTANTYTFSGSGSIMGAGSLAKQGPGTLVLNTANAYTGTTTVSSGTLQIGGAGTLGSGVYGGAISNAGTFQYSSSANQVFSGAISGAGGLIKDTGTGTLTLTAANTYAGPTTINAGTLIVGNSLLGTGIVTTNAQLTISRTNATSLSTIASNVAGIGGTGSVTLTGGAAITLDRSIILTGPSSAINGTASGFSFSGVSIIAPTVNLTASGLSSLASNSTNILGQTGGTTAISSSSSGYYGLYAVNNATVLDTRGNVTITGTTLAGASAIYGGIGLGGTLKNTGGLLTLIADSTASGGRVGFEAGVTGSYGSGLTIDGNVAIQATAGSLNAGWRDAQLFGLTGKGTLMVTGTKYGIVAGGAISSTGGTLNVGFNVTDATNGVLNLTGAISTGGSITANIASTSASNVMSGVISGATTSLTKSGLGTLSLTNTNTYGGTTTVAAGTLAVNGSAIPDAGKLVITSGKVAPTGTEVVGTLFFGAVQQASGTWGSSTAVPTPAHIDDTHFSGTGVVNVTTGATGGYSTWAATNAPTGTSTDDYDGDGVSNGLEWVLGGLASTNDIAKLPTATASGGNFVFTFVRNDAAWQSGDTTAKIEVGTTLASWPLVYNVGIDTAASSAGVTVTDNGTTDTIQLTVAQSPDAAKFARLKVIVTP